MSININGKLRIKGATTGGSGGGTPNYTFKTTAVGETNFAYIETSTGYIKFNTTVYNLTETGGDLNYTLDDPNGEYTLVSCDEFGAPSGDIIYLTLDNNQITNFNGAGLSGLVELRLLGNQLTSFNGTGLSSLTFLALDSNQFTSFNGTGLSSLTTLNLPGNQLTSFDASPFTNLVNLSLAVNPLDSADNDSILAQLDGLGTENGSFFSSGGRTSASDTAYNNLIGKGWFIDVDVPLPPPPTFITTAEVGGTNVTYIETSTGYIKFNATVYPAGEEAIEYTLNDPNGEYTIVSCDEFGAPSGDIIFLNLDGNQITSFNGTELSSLTQLRLGNNGLTSLSGFIFPSSLTSLNLNDNQLTSFNGTGLSSLTALELINNQLTSFNGTGLSSLTELYLNGNQLTSFNGTGLSSLTLLRLDTNQLTSFDASPLTSLTVLYLQNNLLDSADNDSILAQLDDNGVENGQFQSSGNRTSASDTDYNNLIGKGWTIDVNIA